MTPVSEKEMNTLGDRMKGYEDRSTLDPNMYTILRLDGKAFHTYTKHLKRPFDPSFVEAMNITTTHLARNIPGCQVGYIQSDEITLTLKRPSCVGEFYYGGKVQKIVSVVASMASAMFNDVRRKQMKQMSVSESVECASEDDLPLAHFDCRVFQVPTVEEVLNNLIWRQEDCVRNSLHMVALSIASHSQLQGKSQSELIELCGTLWKTLDSALQRGRFLTRVCVKERRTYIRQGQEAEAEVTRYLWQISAAPHFRAEYGILLPYILT